MRLSGPTDFTDCPNFDQVDEWWCCLFDLPLVAHRSIECRWGDLKPSGSPSTGDTLPSQSAALCLPLVRFKDRDAQLDLQNAIADAIDAGCPVPLKRRNGHRNTLHLAQNEWGSEIKYD